MLSRKHRPQIFQKLFGGREVKNDFLFFFAFVFLAVFVICTPLYGLGNKTSLELFLISSDRDETQPIKNGWNMVNYILGLGEVNG